jgi:hypothetical protein
VIEKYAGSDLRHFKEARLGEQTGARQGEGFEDGLSFIHAFLVFASGNGISDDAGATWAPISSGLPNEDVSALAVSGGAKPIVYASVGPRDAFYVSEDGGTTWTNLGQIGGVTGFERRLYLSPINPGLLYYLSRALQFIIARRGGDEDHVLHVLLKFVKTSGRLS